jgi:hypothetical protein
MQSAVLQPLLLRACATNSFQLRASFADETGKVKAPAVVGRAINHESRYPLAIKGI